MKEKKRGYLNKLHHKSSFHIQGFQISEQIKIIHQQLYSHSIIKGLSGKKFSDKSVQNFPHTLCLDNVWDALPKQKDKPTAK